jgi:hypothetical protein
VTDKHVLLRYSATCSKLCNHYKTLKSLIKDDVPDVGQFLQEYRVGTNTVATIIKLLALHQKVLVTLTQYLQLNCPAAYYRLVEIGAPSVPIVPEIPKAIAEAVRVHSDKGATSCLFPPL